MLPLLALTAAVVSSGRARVPQRVYRGVLVAWGVFLAALSVWSVWSGVGFRRVGPT